MAERNAPRSARAFVGIVALTLAGACSAPPQAGSGDEPAVAAQQAPEALPPGHPPVDAAPADSVVAPPPPGSGTGAAALGWTVPEGWTEERPSSSMRRAQYRVQGPGGDGECVVFYFGPGQGGDPMANAVRWAEQFTQPDGRPSREALRTEQLDVGGIPVLLAEVTGTYSGGMTMAGGPSRELAGYMLLGAVARGGDANWFFKFTGPEATVRSHEGSFRALIGSLERGG